MLGLPHAFQGPGGVPLEHAGVTLRDGPFELLREHPHVGEGEVESLGARGRHRVRGVAGQQQVAVLHRLLDEAAERQHRLRGDRALLQGVAVGADPGLELLPDPVVGPVVDVLRRVALEVHPLQGLGALADQREPAVGVVVDQLGRARRRLAEDPEPGERVLPRELPSLRLRELVTADAARPVRRRRGSRTGPPGRRPRRRRRAMPGRSVVTSTTDTSLTPKRTSPPSRARASARSMNTSVCG